ncbi:MAG: toll/interleukin-1 receptor domain-containing protein [Methylocella sp.]
MTHIIIWVWHNESSGWDLSWWGSRLAMLHDVFICHASEDKDDFVRPLAESLKNHHLDVWYDEFTLTIGDSLREAIDRGLANSRFGIVVLSPHFFQKRWPQRELNGLVAREIAEGRPLVLPIWHRISRDEILQHSPPLADVRAVPSTRGMGAVVTELLKRLRPEESPLIVARDFLNSNGVFPPVVTNEWWLDLVEVKESQLRFPDLNLGRRWIFPLPFPEAERGRERGMNIAWTALQMDWASDGEERNLCQLTHPERVHEFLRKWPGLLECGRANPSVLAMYAPQLTIPGFDDGLADVFDELMDPTRDDVYDVFRYGRPDTTDGKKPLCGELIAWRHPTFGNYTDEELAYSFVQAHDTHYSRHLFSSFECLAWLLSDDASWMPQRLRDTFFEGMRNRTYGWSTDIMGFTNAFSDALLDRTRSKFRFTREVRSSIVELFAAALQKLCVQENPVRIAERFIARGFVDGFYDEQDRIRLRHALKKKPQALPGASISKSRQ